MFVVVLYGKNYHEVNHLSVGRLIRFVLFGCLQVIVVSRVEINSREVCCSELLLICMSDILDRIIKLEVITK